MFDYTICKCKQVSYFDVEDALNKSEKFTDVENKIAESAATFLGTHLEI